MNLDRGRGGYATRIMLWVVARGKQCSFLCTGRDKRENRAKKVCESFACRRVLGGIANMNIGGESFDSLSEMQLPLAVARANYISYHAFLTTIRLDHTALPARRTNEATINFPQIENRSYHFYCRNSSKQQANHVGLGGDKEAVPRHRLHARQCNTRDRG